MNDNSTLDEGLIERAKPVSLFFILLVPLLVSPLLGVTTNFINVDISQDYFEMMMGWDSLSDSYVIFLAMQQGAVEGVIYGAIFSFIFTIYVARGNHARLGNKFFSVVFIWVIIIVLVCWLVGGILGVVVFRQFPEFGPSFNNILTFGETYLRLRYGWVAGSIWGSMIGGVLALAWAIWKTFRQRIGSLAP